MTKISSAPLSRFRNNQHLFLMTKLQFLIIQETALKLGIVVLDTAFNEAVAAETEAVKVEEGSIFTQKLDSKSLERKNLYDGFGNILENGLKHYDLAKRDAAQHIERVTEKYGNINLKSKTERTVAFRNLASDLLNEVNMPNLILIEAVEWVKRFQTTNEEHDTLYLSRNKEETERISGNVHRARLFTDPCYLAIVDNINAQITLNGDANYLSLVSQLNGVIEDLKINLAMQKSKKEAVTPPVV